MYSYTITTTITNIININYSKVLRIDELQWLTPK